MFYQGEPLSPPTGWSISEANESANEDYTAADLQLQRDTLAEQSV